MTDHIRKQLTNSKVKSIDTNQMVPGLKSREVIGILNLLPFSSMCVVRTRSRCTRPSALGIEVCALDNSSYLVSVGKCILIATIFDIRRWFSFYFNDSVLDKVWYRHFQDSSP